MYISDYFRFSIKGLLSKKTRFMLTVLSVFIGVFSKIFDDLLTMDYSFF